MRGIALVLVVAGCTIPPRIATLETADVLAAHEHEVAFGGGGGGGNLDASIGGGAARVRDGLGGGQELGIDASFLWSGSTVIGGAALAYKRALGSGLALTAGAGVTGGNEEQATCAAVDVGAIASTRPGDGRVQLYAGVRVAAAMPVTGDRHAGGGLSQTAIVPIGLAVPWRGGWRVIVEAGAIGALSEARDPTPGAMELRTSRHEGGYGALALALGF
jgi:hypothetical protein